MSTCWPAIALAVASVSMAMAAGCDDKTEYPDSAIVADAAPDAEPDLKTDASPDTYGGDYCPMIQIQQGPIQGKRQAASCVYLGIPYGKAPVGKLRWKRAEAPDPWTKVMPMDTPGAGCTTIPPSKEAGPEQGEDCLKLNVWTPHPQPGKPAPVLVWIGKGRDFWNGGIYKWIRDDGQVVWDDGTTLAEQHGLVMVTADWRRGPLGFLVHPALGSDSGNYGLFDQQDLLKWVQDNIAQLGGDPKRVTLYGGGMVGAQSVCTHLVSETSKGLFQRAIMESGFCPQDWINNPTVLTRAQAEITGQELVKAVGCDIAADVADCLRGKSAPEINDALVPKAWWQKSGPGNPVWRPIIDSVNLKGQPANLLESGAIASKVPLLIGSAEGDGGLFFSWSNNPYTIDEPARQDMTQKLSATHAATILAMYPLSDYTPVPAGSRATPSAYALKESATDWLITCPSRRAARAAAKQMPVYRIIQTLPVSACFDDPTSAYPCAPNQEPFLGTTWLSFNVFVFHTPQTKPVPPYFWEWTFNADEEKLSQAAMGYFARFAMTGDPNGGGAVQWPKYDEAGDQVLVLHKNPTAKVVTGLRKKQCDMWDTIH